LDELAWRRGFDAKELVEELQQAAEAPQIPEMAGAV